MEHDITITIILRASSPSINSLRASSSSGDTKTAIQARLERLNSPYAIYQDDLKESDVRCGSGTFLKSAHELYEYAVGIDLSMSMLKVARRRRTGKTDLVLATSRLLPIKNESVDCLVSISTLRADSSLRAATGEMKRICRKNAVLAVSLFQHPEDDVTPLLAGTEHSSRISGRETVYFLRLGD